MADKEQIITREMVINEIIKRYPATIGVFNRFKELEELVAALNEAAR